jgi:ribonuclease Z
VEPWLQSLAYRVDMEGGSIVFAGDTGPCDTLDRLAVDADVLVVNCRDHQGTTDENGEGSGQTGTLDAANMALNAGAKKLILTHTGPQLNVPGQQERGIAGIASLHHGEIVFGEELMRIDLGAT